MKKITIIGFIFFSLFLLGACSEKESENTQPFAKVGDIVITEEDFYNELKNSVGSDVLKQMVLEELLTNNYSASEKEIANAIEETKKEQGFETKKDLEKALKENGLTFEQFQRNTKMRLLLEKASVDGIVVTEEEMKREYEQLADQIRASHILVKEKSQADEIAKKLKNGENFEELAKKFSVDGSSEKGGDLGYFGREYMTKPFEDAAFALSMGEISEPIQTEFGYHIIKVTDADRTYDEMKEDIKQALLIQKTKSTEEIFSTLLKDQKITIRDKDLKESFKEFQNE